MVNFSSFSIMSWDTACNTQFNFSRTVDGMVHGCRAIPFTQKRFHEYVYICVCKKFCDNDVDHDKPASLKRVPIAIVSAFCYIIHSLANASNASTGQRGERFITRAIRYYLWPGNNKHLMCVSIGREREWGRKGAWHAYRKIHFNSQR